jgi:cephalosporin-C deacetylase
MKKMTTISKASFRLIAASAVMFFAACAPSVQPTYTVVEDAEWFALSPDVPTVKVMAEAGEANATGRVRLVVEPDKCLRFDAGSRSFVYEPLPAVYDRTQKVKATAGSTSEVVFDVELPEAGFYRCLVIADGRDTLKTFNIGLDPEQIVSPVDAQPDFDEFWARTRAELDAVAPEWEVTPLPDSSSVVRTIYRIAGRSLGGEIIQGFYAQPNKPGKYPAIIHYMGYNSPAWCFDPDANPDRAEFVLSVRGQGLNQPTNKYGDWIQWGLDNKEDYYYRGAFMDLVRAIDFVASRPEVDTDNIFAEGGSQGGAFTMVAAALDSRIKAAAPTIPFLSDYRDYFSIVAWPSGSVLSRAAELGISDDELYKTLSYFDVKNFAGKITCPVIMGFGLQDGVCPPHTNFAGYNQITSPKEYRVYPQSGHWTGPDWYGEMNSFFEKAK